ncbi:hypothetical protein AKJ51_01460 [candidate division MSBL1 archaeon SCGC-AAA382A20]|uniref:Uncharacterized protein n=1 Tax=candidate division MSBL1 archaeon SCGC-AAA382A20 TaxID=1698280 RepID=A0A133VLQ8_9EURY|nr:hypothetical protein AKJ51_01460 [candidate division MSBL1 archaeon SCGC-AAA382A20]
MSWKFESGRHALASRGVKSKSPIIMTGDYDRDVIKDLENIIENSDIDCDVILSTVTQFGIIHLGFEDDSGADIGDLRILRNTLEEYAEEHNMRMKYMLHDGRVGYTIY